MNATSPPPDVDAARRQKGTARAAPRNRVPSLLSAALLLLQGGVIALMSWVQYGIRNIDNVTDPQPPTSDEVTIVVVGLVLAALLVGAAVLALAGRRPWWCAWIATSVDLILMAIVVYLWEQKRDALDLAPHDFQVLWIGTALAIALSSVVPLGTRVFHPRSAARHPWWYAGIATAVELVLVTIVVVLWTDNRDPAGPLLPRDPFELLWTGITAVIVLGTVLPLWQRVLRPGSPARYPMTDRP